MNKIRLLISCFVLSYVLLISTASEAVQYNIRIINAPEGHNYSGASGINDFGKIAGYSAPNINYNNFPFACVWDNSGAYNIGFTLNSSRAAEINNRGEVVGKNILYKNGEMSTLPTLSTSSYMWNSFTDINNQGCIIGQSGTGIANGANACYWDSTGIHDLGVLSGDNSSIANGVNEQGQIVGTSQRDAFPSSLAKAFIWNNNKMTELGMLSGYNQSQAFDINNSKQVVGSSLNEEYRYSGIYERAFIWQNDVMTDLLGLNNVSSRALKITDSGFVLGYAYSNSGFYSPFVWKSGTVTWLQGFGRINYYACDINESGWIVGQADATDNTYHAVVWEPVPEPSSLIALFSGIVTLGCVRMRRRGN